MADRIFTQERKGINDLTLQYVSSLLSYDPETGEIRWRVERRGRPGSMGQIAGSIGNRRYRAIGIDGRLYQVHRLIWLLMTGEWPKNDIDHINGNGTDNRWCNIREATISQNMANHAGHRDNKSGYKGVTFFKRDSIWQASIQMNKMVHYLGRFKTPEEASAAYQRAAKELHGEFARF